ncbi:MAG: DNA-binding domain-containing protein [Pseudomonadota bacterium]
MKTTQARFVDALTNADAPRPHGLSDGQGRAAGRRFDVYRNNVVASLIEALETAFPCIQKLVGTQNFKVLARAFVERHPPSSPLMMFYGVEMPEFLAAFPPTQTTGYLPDIARLEAAMRNSYHAADAEPIDPNALQAMSPDRLMLATVKLAPALQLIRSPWPIHAIWRYNMEPDAPKPEMRAEDVLILRPDLDPQPQLLPPGGGAFVAALQADQPFGDALASAQQVSGAFDLAAVLTLLITGCAIEHIGENE